MTDQATDAQQQKSAWKKWLGASRSRRYLTGGAITLAVIGALGFLAVPPMLRSVLEKQLTSELGRETHVGQVDFNPYALSLRVADVSIRAKDGEEFAGFDELYVNLSSASLFKAAAVVDEIRLQGPRVRVVRLAEGQYDISDLIEKWSQPKDEPEQGTPRFSLNNIRLLDGRLRFDDRVKQRVHQVEELNIGLPFVSSLPYQAEVVVQPMFSAKIDGSQLALNGDSKPFSASRESELRLDLDQFDLAALQPYLPESLPVRLRSGKLDTELKAVFKEVSEQTYSLALLGAAHVSALALEESDGKPLLGWQQLDIDLGHGDLVARRFDLNQIKLHGLALNLNVDQRGQLNLLRIAERLSGKPAAAAKPAPEPAAKAPTLAWSLGGFVLDKAQIHWRDESNAKPQSVDVRDIELHVGKLDSQLKAPLLVSSAALAVDAGEALQMPALKARNIRVDLGQQRVDVGELAGRQWQAKLVRLPGGAIEWLLPPVLNSASANSGKPAAASSSAGGKAWQVLLAEIHFNDLGLRFEDQSSKPSAVQTLTGLSIDAQNLGTVSGSKGKLAIKGKVNSKGSIDISGPLQLVPLDTALKLETVAIPLMPLQPYFTDYLNVALTRGQFSNKGEALVTQQGEKLKAAYKGSVTLGDFLVLDKLNSADFLKWKSLYVGGIDFRLEPMALTVGEIALTDFYSRLILNESGQLNVATIVRKPEADKSAPAQMASTPPEAAGKAVLPIKIAKVTLQNGTVNFSDFFIKPNYSVNLANLGGRVTGLSSEEGTVADLDLRASYGNAAPVQILAKLNPLAAKSYLDLKADVTGVDMVGFSPYAGKYAGYAIEKGKLSLNVAYKLEAGRLNAENRLFIDQFTFGDKVDSPDATKLPVNLAIALLKNNRGEIDLNLPIAGSLDDPQFSVGGVIIQVIGNLFVKAVTSPFALLGSMFGGGEELSNVEFAPGYASFDAAALKRLASLAKALNERSGLKLEVAGRADPEADREGIKRAAIERAMKVEKLKEITRKSGEGQSLDEIRIDAGEYPAYLARAYKEAKFPKPRNMIGLQKELPVEEMEKLMLANLPVNDEDVRALAVRRAEAVQAWLVDQGKIAPERVFLLPPKVDSEREAKARASRVDFSLR